MSESSLSRRVGADLAHLVGPNERERPELVAHLRPGDWQPVVRRRTEVGLDVGADRELARRTRSKAIIHLEVLLTATLFDALRAREDVVLTRCGQVVWVL
jgi:hypothetical protein